jgi:glycosyltransferase involved in cell wall biosynthesis
LPRCIESVLAQDFYDFELIIVDDGSIDHTAHLIKNYSDPRIKYIYAEHHRQAYAKNLGIQFASATWITFR